MTRFVCRTAVALIVGTSTGAAVLAQDTPAAPDPTSPVSLSKIREAASRTPALDLDRRPVDRQLPAATFKTAIEVRSVMVPFDEYLRQQLELTPLQRQSYDWASRCCGIDLGLLFDPIDRALERRKTRKVRQRITRELADLAASRKAVDANR